MNIYRKKCYAKSLTDKENCFNVSEQEIRFFYLVVWVFLNLGMSAVLINYNLHRFE